MAAKAARRATRGQAIPVSLIDPHAQRDRAAAAIDHDIDLAAGRPIGGARLLERADPLAVDRDDHVAGDEAGGAEGLAAVAARADDDAVDAGRRSCAAAC